MLAFWLFSLAAALKLLLFFDNKVLVRVRALAGAGPNNE
jgi:hypothetical protein